MVIINALELPVFEIVDTRVTFTKKSDDSFPYTEL